jgi:hypothetical protein
MVISINYSCKPITNKNASSTFLLLIITKHFLIIDNNDNVKKCKEF